MIEHFIPASSTHAYGPIFRETWCLSNPKVKHFGKKYIGWFGLRYVLWNELPSDIWNIQSYLNFIQDDKKTIFARLISNVCVLQYR